MLEVLANAIERHAGKRKFFCIESGGDIAEIAKIINCAGKGNIFKYLNIEDLPDVQHG